MKNNIEIKNLLLKIKKCFLEANTKKYLISKIILFFVLTIVVLSTSFVCRDLAINNNVQNYSLINNFININIIGNNGISFSFLSGASTSLIYFIQSVPIIIAFIFFIFLKNMFLCGSILLVFLGGMCNIIDRSIVDNYKYFYNIVEDNAVVDYLQFSFIPGSAIFNLPDVYIVFGIILIFIIGVYTLAKNLIINKEKNENK